MIKKIVFSISCIVLLWGQNNISDRKWISVSKNDTVNSFITLELFTSEGCSDCPTAEAVLNKFVNDSRKNNTNIISISQHVDYWNDLIEGQNECKGKWIDKFSQGYFTSRQFEYAKKLNIQPATPQIVINGSELITDPKEEDVKNLISKYLSVKPMYSLVLDLNNESKIEGNEILVDFKIKQNEIKKDKKYAPQLLVFLVEREIISIPDKGENCGTELHHQNIARSWISKTIRSSNTGTVKLTIPQGVNLSNASVVGIIQNLYGLEIMGASNGFDFKEK